MAACVVHAGGSDGGIQAHIKACAALGAICSSVVVAHNTIVVQMTVHHLCQLPEMYSTHNGNIRICIDGILCRQTYIGYCDAYIIRNSLSFSLLSGGSSIILRIIL
uniref:Uncharacterized protein n=1 Tax=Oryza glaberrima TaxID=4538 RepID=I1PD62_ORYGL